MTIQVAVIASAGHVINPLQKRVMTMQVAVIASRAKQSRTIDNVRINDFVIISIAKQSRKPDNVRFNNCFIIRNEAI